MINKKRYFSKKRSGKGRPRKSDYHSNRIVIIVLMAMVLLCWLIGRYYEYRRVQEKAFLEYLAPLRDSAGFICPAIEATTSAKPTTSTLNERHDTTIAVIDRYLAKKKSPMAGLGKWLYEIPRIYGITNPYLMASISGCESSFGKQACHFNAFGWNSCNTTFESWIEGIEKVSRKLATLSYYKEWRQDQDNIAELAFVYNPGGAKEWKNCVKGFMVAMKLEELR
jgi:hypothetical protein